MRYILHFRCSTIAKLRTNFQQYFGELLLNIILFNKNIIASNYVQ